MKTALDLIEAGSLPHCHSHACVVVDEAGAAEVELSFFDYQRQAYIGESGLSPRPFFFPAWKRTLADGRAGYVVGPKVTRYLRRDARFGVASREGRLGDLRCKARTYVESKGGRLPLEFAVPRQERSQGERPEISSDAASSSQSSSRGKQSGPWGPWAVVGLDEKKAERSQFEASAQTARLQERVARQTPETANTFKNLLNAIFEDLFGDVISWRGRKHGSDLRYNMEITLDEAFHGKTVSLSIPTSAGCEVCNGTGAKTGAKLKTCGTCGGMGRVRAQQGFFAIERACPTCQGHPGKIIDDHCPSCAGAGHTTVERELSVNVPPGVEDGACIRLTGEGEAGLRGGPRGDLYIFLSIR